MTPQERALDDRVPQMLIVADCAAAAAAYAAAVAAALPGPFAVAAAAFFPHLLFFAGCWLVAAADRDYWRVRRAGELAGMLPTLLRAGLYAAAYSVVLMALFGDGGVRLGFLGLFFALGAGALLAVRAALLGVTALVNRAGFMRRGVLIVGANDRTRRLVDRLRGGHGHNVVGVIDDEFPRGRRFCGEGIPYMGPCRALEAALVEHDVDDIFIGLTLRSHFETIRQIGRDAERHGVVVHVLADLFPAQHAKPVPLQLHDIPMLAMSPVPENRAALVVKRVMDFVGSSVLLVALAPLFLLIAVLIKLDSKGPVFFMQERAGCNQRRFKMIKFRSMVANAEELRAALEAQNEVDGPAFKLRRDPRVTRIGAFMRKHSLDELPQLINVWKGEMSLVGPRPAVASDADKYDLIQRRRLSVKQGMTGLWQVSGRHGLSFEEWLRLDLGYIDSWSLFQDVVILVKTFREVVQGRNAA